MADYSLAQLDKVLKVFEAMMPFALKLLALLWAIHVVNSLVGYRLNYLGIMPRKWSGMIGIVFSPWLHGNFNHIFFNSIPLFVLSIMLLTEGWYSFIAVVVSVTVLGGLGIWLFGRRAIHIGASTTIMGMFGYLAIRGYMEPTLLSGLLLFICLYYFGGLVASLLPQEDTVSWEGHVFGFMAGIISYFIKPYLLPWFQSMGL